MLKSDGEREYRDTTSILPGDTVLVLAGERIPADGTIISGTARSTSPW